MAFDMWRVAERPKGDVFLLLDIETPITYVSKTELVELGQSAFDRDGGHARVEYEVFLTLRRVG